MGLVEICGLLAVGSKGIIPILFEGKVKLILNRYKIYSDIHSFIKQGQFIRCVAKLF